MKGRPTFVPTGCAGKRKYESYAIAERLAKRQRQQQDGACVGPYHCTACKFFHIGTNREHGARDKRKAVMP